MLKLAKKKSSSRNRTKNNVKTKQNHYETKNTKQTIIQLYENYGNKSTTQQ